MRVLPDTGRSSLIFSRNSLVWRRWRHQSHEEASDKDHDKGADGQHQQIVSSVIGKGETPDKRKDECAQSEATQGECGGSSPVMGPICCRNLDGTSKGTATSHTSQEAKEAESWEAHGSSSLLVGRV